MAAERIGIASVICRVSRVEVSTLAGKTSERAGKQDVVEGQSETDELALATDASPFAVESVHGAVPSIVRMRGSVMVIRCFPPGDSRRTGTVREMETGHQLADERLIGFGAARTGVVLDDGLTVGRRFGQPDGARHDGAEHAVREVPPHLGDDVCRQARAGVEHRH